MNPLLATLFCGLLMTTAFACEDPPEPAPEQNENANGELAVCLQGDPFIESGSLPIDAAAGGDAYRITEVRWEDHGECERLVIDLEEEDQTAPTSAGHVTAEVLRDLGVVRIHLHEVRWVDPDATDARFNGPLTKGVYVIWPPDGEGTYVDVHLESAAEAHVTLLEEPARVVIDLRPGGSELPNPPVTHNFVVVLEPRPGEASYPLTVIGYARTFEANVVARLEHDGEEVFSDFTTATAWVDAWGHYRITVDEGPSGPVTLHVGEYSAKDGTWDGVEVELDMR